MCLALTKALTVCTEDCSHAHGGTALGICGAAASAVAISSAWSTILPQRLRLAALIRAFPLLVTSKLTRRARAASLLAIARAASARKRVATLTLPTLASPSVVTASVVGANTVALSPTIARGRALIRSRPADGRIHRAALLALPRTRRNPTAPCVATIATVAATVATLAQRMLTALALSTSPTFIRMPRGHTLPAALKLTRDHVLPAV